MKQIGRYRIIRELGKGGMAVVYLAHDPRFERDVAVKVLSDKFTNDPEFRRRFEREAKTIAGLEHAAIVPVYDFGEEGDQPYLVMRYMACGSLDARLRIEQLPLGEICEILTRIAAALDEVHQKGYIHRDIKPPNVLFDQAREAYLADFGIARVVVRGKVTHAGTPGYMAPEQRVAESLDARTDVYQLGVVLFNMLTGCLVRQGKIRSVHKYRADLPTGCDRVIARALAQKKDARYGSAGELATAFAALVKRDALLTRPRQIPTSLPSPPSPPTGDENQSTEPVAKDQERAEHVPVGKKQPYEMAAAYHFDLIDQVRDCVNSLWGKEGLVGFVVPCSTPSFIENFGERLKYELGRNRVRLMRPLEIDPIRMSIDRVILTITRQYRPALRERDVLFTVRVPKEEMASRFWQRLQQAVEKEKFPNRLIVIVALGSGGVSSDAALIPLKEPHFDIADVHRWVRGVVSRLGWSDDLFQSWTAQMIAECSHNNELQIDWVYIHLNAIVELLQQHPTIDHFRQELQQRKQDYV